MFIWAQYSQNHQCRCSWDSIFDAIIHNNRRASVDEIQARNQIWGNNFRKSAGGAAGVAEIEARNYADNCCGRNQYWKPFKIFQKTMNSQNQRIRSEGVHKIEARNNAHNSCDRNPNWKPWKVFQNSKNSENQERRHSQDWSKKLCRQLLRSAAGLLCSTSEWLERSSCAVQTAWTKLRYQPSIG